MLSVIIIGLFGALIGSFANVVIYRLPNKQSIVFPGSSCPNCGHKIKPWENIPVLSWLFLAGKCSSCKNPISIRYPLIEALTALGFVLLALRWPVEQYGFTILPLLALYAMLVMMSLIDIDHFILPDSLTLPAIGIGILGTLLYAPESGLPTLNQALVGGAVGAGIIALINRVGSLVVRRFADTKERLWPIGMDQVNVAAVGGALGGWSWGVGAAAASLLLNLITRKPIRLPELAVYGLWLLALLISSLSLIVNPLRSLGGTFAAAGIVSIIGAVFWWFRDLIMGESQTSTEDDEPVAMGFGDVKLAAILGVMLGWKLSLVALLFAFVLGAIGGITMRLTGGGRIVPFGPYLALGGMLALFYGNQTMNWYLRMLGL